MNSNYKLALSIFWIICGAALVWLSIAQVLDASLCSGMGGALIAIGTIRIIQYVRYRKDAGYREKIDTAVSDERNRFLRMKSWTWAGIIVIFAECIGAVVAMILGERSVFHILSSFVCLMLVVYCIAYAVLSRKY